MNSGYIFSRRTPRGLSRLVGPKKTSYLSPEKGELLIMQVFLILLSFASMIASLAMAFVYAPTEASMGIVQKIFYFHVPAAYTTYLSWAVCTVSSIMYMVKPSEKWDMAAKSAAEVALVFAGIVLITGPLWGRKSWGAYWAFDPRLTSMLLFTLIVAAYVLLRGIGTGETERKFSAALAILGACIVPIIHISVYKWRGQHPSVMRDGGLAPSMLHALMAAILSFTAFYVLLFVRRYRLEQNKRRLAAIVNEAAALGLIGEGE
jgi:heme exporter protein C